MKFGVFDNGKPASHEGFPLKNSCWEGNVFNTLEEAQQYTDRWLGQFRGPTLQLDQAWDYSGHGDLIEIRSIQ